METIEIKSWEEFLPIIKKIREEYGKPHSRIGQNRILYRGHSDANWKLQSTLERFSKEEWTLNSYAKLSLRCAPQIESFTNKSWHLPTCSELSEQLESLSSSEFITISRVPCYDFWVYIRHHGFPSPLLDWSLSPYIAAFFAFSSRGSSEKSAIFAYIETPKSFKTASGGEPSIKVLGPYTPSHQRHFLQQAYYSVCTQVKGKDRQFICHEKVFENPEPNEQDVLIKIVIPSTERMKILSDLNDYNINAFSLFQSEDALVQTMVYKEIEMKENL